MTYDKLIATISIEIHTDAATAQIRESWEWLVDEYVHALVTHDYDYAASVQEDLDDYDLIFSIRKVRE